MVFSQKIRTFAGKNVETIKNLALMEPFLLFLMVRCVYGRMAQLVRAPRSHRGDRWFDSSCAHFFSSVYGVQHRENWGLEA